MQNKHKRWAVAIMLFLAFITIVPIGVLFISSVPNITVPSILQMPIDYWPNHPNITVTCTFLFTAQGSISVNNPVTVFVSINSTDPNLLQDYPWIAFTEAYNISTVGNPNQAPTTAFLSITATTTPNIYQASGQVIWLIDGSSWPYLTPTIYNVVVYAVAVEAGYPAITVASATDTLSIQNNIKSEQLTWVLVGVSILAFQPIISVFIPEDKISYQKITCQVNCPFAPSTPSTPKAQSKARKWLQKFHREAKSD